MELVYSVFSKQAQIQTGSLCLCTILLPILLTHLTHRLRARA